MKLRRDIVRIVNNISTQHDYKNFDFDLFGCYDMILNYCKAHKVAPSNLNVESDNGVLVINGEHIDRVAAFNSIYNVPQKRTIGIEFRFF